MKIKGKRLCVHFFLITSKSLSNIFQLKTLGIDLDQFVTLVPSNLERLFLILC